MGSIPIGIANNNRGETSVRFWGTWSQVLVAISSVVKEKLLELCSRCKFGVKTFKDRVLALALKIRWRLWKFVSKSKLL